MCDQLTLADLDRATQEVEDQRKATTLRHAQELQELKEKQADEILILNAKEAQLVMLDILINGFVSEFKLGAAPTRKPGSVIEKADINEATLSDAADPGAPIVGDAMDANPSGVTRPARFCQFRRTAKNRVLGGRRIVVGVPGRPGNRAHGHHRD